MSNISNLPIKIYAGMRVAESFLQMSSAVKNGLFQNIKKYMDQSHQRHEDLGF
jgi:deoxycytidine triphosphate deaminase